MKSKIKKIVQKAGKFDKNSLLWMAIGFIVIINIGLIFQSTAEAKKKIAVAEESARPASISITVIKDSSCADCADIQPYVDITKKQNIKITKEETLDTKSEQGQKLIRELDIKRLPTFILAGELDKSDNFKKLLASGGEFKNNNFVFTLPIAPYFDMASGQIKGRNVNVTLIEDKSCKECYNVKVYKDFLASVGINKLASQIELDKTDAAAKEVIKKYDITVLPTFILSGEVSEYPNLTKAWPNLGTVEKDGAYIFREAKRVGVYFDLKTKKAVDPRAVAKNP